MVLNFASARNDIQARIARHAFENLTLQKVIAFRCVGLWLSMLRELSPELLCSASISQYSFQGHLELAGIRIGLSPNKRIKP